MESLLVTTLAFLFGISLLVAFHEFGHFYVARLSGVTVLRFSIGFGKPIFSCRDKKGTEYVIGLIPLGGYVQMLDESQAPVPASQLMQAFNRQSLWKRFAIVAAGPIFNLIFSVLALWAVFVIGITAVKAVVGEVKPLSIAQRAGLQPNDAFVSIASQDAQTWRQVGQELVRHAGESEPLPIVINRKGVLQTLSLPLSQLQLDEKNPDVFSSIGVTPLTPKIPPIIKKVVKNSPADLAGIRANDVVLKVDGVPVNSWNSFVSYIRVRALQIHAVTVLRGGQQITLSIKPLVSLSRNKQSVGFLGVQSTTVNWPTHMLITERYSFVHALLVALNKTLNLTTTSFQLIGKLFSGQLSWKNLSGPVGVAQGAGVTLQIGFVYYLSFLAFVSVGLAVLNLLPIPVLDGGHLLYYAIEFVRGRPVSEKAQTIALKLGYGFLIVLMFVAFYNDITRLIG